MKKALFTILILVVISFLFFYVAPVFSGDRAVDSDIFFGPIRLHMYGFSIALALLTAWYIAFQIVDRFGISKGDLDKSLLWIVVPGLMGARIYFVLFELQYFLEHPVETIAFWNGGMSIYGALIGGVLGLLLFSRVKGLPFLKFLDITAVVVPLGQSIGRWGNFFNQEAFGEPTSLAWGLYISPRFRPAEFLQSQYFHPTFLYESIWNLIVFYILLTLSKKLRKPGVIAAYYLMLYPAGRFFIESLRLDSVFIASVRVDQAVSLVVMLLGGALLFFLTRPLGQNDGV